jgi:hypothetical protein
MPAEPGVYVSLVRLRDYVRDPVIYDLLYKLFHQEAENPADARWQSKYEKMIQEAAKGWKPRSDENREDYAK